MLKSLELSAVFIVLVACVANSQAQDLNQETAPQSSISCPIFITNSWKSEKQLDRRHVYAGVEKYSGRELLVHLHKQIRHNLILFYDDVAEHLPTIDRDPREGCETNIILLYTGRSESAINRYAGEDKLICGRDDPYRLGCWDREHLWPTSHGLPDEDYAAYTDLHGIRPTDRTINSSRQSRDFDDGGRRLKEFDQIRYDSDSWEPPDDVKGDVARSIFYMATRYNDGIGATGPLSLEDFDTEDGSTQFGYLCTLLYWNDLDPVSDWEFLRNDSIDEIQKNRNPFIDNKAFARQIWGELCVADFTDE